MGGDCDTVLRMLIEAQAVFHAVVELTGLLVRSA